MYIIFIYALTHQTYLGAQNTILIHLKVLYISFHPVPPPTSVLVVTPPVPGGPGDPYAI